MIETTRKYTGEAWRDLQGAAAYFGCGRGTIERIAAESDAKRKIGRRALYNLHRMSDWLDSQGKEETA